MSIKRNLAVLVIAGGALQLLLGCSDSQTPTTPGQLSSGVALSSTTIPTSSATIPLGSSTTTIGSSTTILSSSTPIIPTTSSSSIKITTSSSSTKIVASSSSKTTTTSSSSNSVLSSSTVVINPTLPQPVAGATTKNGWNSRYWDCCKPSCSNRENIDTNANPFGIGKNCSINNTEIAAFTLSPNVSQYWTGYQSTPSGCTTGGKAYTCYSQAPYAVNDTIAYGYAAVPASDASCGRCFMATFDGGNHDNQIKQAHKLLKGKHMVVLASNIGTDVTAGQFDIMIPGGGMGVFTGGCAAEWNVSASDQATVGAPYGGFLTYCQQSLGYDATVSAYQSCVKNMCTKLFGASGREDLLSGCNWFANWMYAADNPTFTYTEVQCPAELTGGYRSTINTTKATTLTP